MSLLSFSFKDSNHIVLFTYFQAPTDIPSLAFRLTESLLPPPEQRQYQLDHFLLFAAHLIVPLITHYAALALVARKRAQMLGLPTTLIKRRVYWACSNREGYNTLGYRPYIPEMCHMITRYILQWQLHSPAYDQSLGYHLHEQAV